MPYYSRSEGAVDDFDEHDPTPYGGGYDIFLTYGRPLEPSDEICYPIGSTSQSDEIDYDRPSYSSYSEPCAYGEEALENEYKSYACPKPRFPPPAEEGLGGSVYRPTPERSSGYGYQQDGEFGSGYGGGIESDYGSGYNHKPEYEAPRSVYGSGYGRKTEYEAPGSNYGAGYRREPEFEVPISEYGSGHFRKPDYEGSDTEYRSGFDRNTDYETPNPEYGSRYDRRSEYESSDRYEHGQRPEFERPPSYGRPPDFGRSGYGIGEGGEYGRREIERPSYGRLEEEVEYRKPSHESYARRDFDEDESREYGYGGGGYGRKKYDDDNSEDDEEKKQRHHRRSYEDE